MKAFSFLLALSVGVFAVGCTTTKDDAASASTSAGVTAQEDPDHLRDVTVLSGNVVVGQKSDVSYTPGIYATWDNDGDIDTSEDLPYLAYKIAPAVTKTAPAPLSVTVSGDFPGTPRVLVVDEKFNVLADTHSHPTGGIAVATVAIPAATTGGDRFVLVRDNLWVSPMSFEITVAQ